MSAIGSAFIEITADNKKALTSIAQTEKKVGGLSKGVKALGAAFIALGGAMVLKDIVKTFGDFQQGVSNAASVTGAFGKELEATKKNITSVSKTLGKETVFSASEAANAFYDLASAGFEVAKITKKDMNPLLDLAAATQSELTFATETMTGVLSSFGWKMDKTAKVADVFTKTIGSSKATLDKLNTSYQVVGSEIDSYNLSIEDSNAALGTLFNRNVDASRAGNALKNMLLRTGNTTPRATKALAKYGLTQKDIEIETKGLIPTLKLLEKAQISNADASIIFGRQYGGLAQILIKNQSEVAKLSTSLEDSSGTAQNVAKNQLNTLKGSLKLMSSNIESFKLAIGEKIAPAIRKFAELIGKVASNEEIQVFFGDLFSAIAEILTALLPLITLIAQLTAGLFKLAKPLIDYLNPALSVMIELFKMIKEDFVVLDELIKKSGGLFELLGTVISDQFDIIKRSIDNFILDIDFAIKNVFQFISDFIANIVLLINESILSMLEFIGSSFINMFGILNKWGDDSIAYIVGIDWGSAFDNIIISLDTKLAEALNRVKQWARDIWNAAKSAMSGAINSAKSAIGFSSGGFTGTGGEGQVAGLVHKGEYVIPANVLERLKPTGLLGALENMRGGGFKNGGFTSPNSVISQMPQSNNNTTVNLDVQQNVNDKSDLQGAAEEMLWTFQQRLI